MTYHLIRTDTLEDQCISTYASYADAVEAKRSIEEDCVVEMPQIIGKFQIVTDTGIIV